MHKTRDNIYAVSCNFQREHYICRAINTLNKHARILLVRKPKVLLLGRPSCRWKNNLKIDIKKNVMGFADTVTLGQDFCPNSSVTLSTSLHRGSPPYIVWRMNRFLGDRSSETWSHPTDTNNNKET
jgi:hypothetical protein